MHEKEKAEHGWIEIGNYVYIPSLLKMMTLNYKNNFIIYDLSYENGIIYI